MFLLIVMLALGLVGCGGEEAPVPGTLAKFDVGQDAAFFDAPFPMAHRARDDGSLRLSDFPNDIDNALIDQMISLLEEGRSGFSLNGAVFFPFEAPIIDARLPESVAASLEDDQTVIFVNIDPQSDELGERVPFEWSVKAEAETYSPENLLVVLPFQGYVLEPRTRYAVIVRRGFGDAEGRPLFQPEQLEVLLRGDVPAGPDGALLAEAFAPLIDHLEGASISIGDVASAAVFTTGDPLAETTAWQAQVASATPPAITAPELVDTYDEYCVVSARVSLPIFQQGPKPYSAFGQGQMVVDGDGLLVEQERDDAEIILTIPHGAMPEAGFPLVLYAAGSEGLPRQVIDRTAIDADPAEGLGPPGQGPAKIFAAHGVAAFGMSAPLTHDRHPSGSPGLLDFFNVGNLGSFRDNFRQGMLDFTTVVNVVAGIALDATLCPQASSSSGSFRYDPDQLFLFGHSTGSTIGSGVIALEPEVRGAILSGAGGSWIYNVTLAEAPLKMANIAGVLLNYQHPDVVDAFDPAVTLFQTTLESIEVMDWGAATVHRPLSNRSPKQLLLIEGLIDTFHFPRMVNAYAMSVGIDLLEPELEPTAREEYALVSREVISPPAIGNIDLSSGDITAVTIQREQNEHDGHYVPFEHDDVKYRYGCFIASMVRDGTATVPAPEDDVLTACP